MCDAVMRWAQPVLVVGVNGEPLLQDAAHAPHSVGDTVDVLLPGSEREQLTCPRSDP